MVVRAALLLCKEAHTPAPEIVIALCKRARSKETASQSAVPLLLEKGACER